jgi:hypothetical protein
MTPITGDGNGEREVMGCDHFQRGRGGGGEAAPRCRRRMAHRGTMRRPGRPKAVTGIWRSKMTKGNWVGRLNAWLGRTADWADKKIMAESMRWVRKIGEEILVGQNEKGKYERIFGLLKIRNLIQMVCD